MKKKNYISILALSLLLALGNGVFAKLQSSASSNATIVNKEKLEFTAFVNGQELHIDFENEIIKTFTVELYDITGKRVDSWKVEKTSQLSCELNLNQPLRKGLYIIKISTNKQEAAKKLQT